MCGIYAIIKKDNDVVSEEELSDGTTMLKHRGPDGMGHYVHNNVGLGHTRLAIIDLSDGGIQPMHKHNNVITYNGEIYNYQALKRELSDLGHRFTSQSDTEVILSAFEEWGPGFEYRLNGMWAFIILNQSDQSIYISRDRYGMKPLYELNRNGTSYFSSEIKAFSSIPGYKQELNKDVVHDFIIEGLLHHRKESLYTDVFSFPASSYRIIQNDGKTIEQTYYTIEQHETDVSAETLKATFIESVQRHMLSDVPVAASLSGGIDSSSFVAVAALENDNLHTFSYVPEEKEISEEKFIDAVIDNSGVDNHKISPSFKDHLSHHLDVLKANDSPALSMSLISHYLKYKRVKEAKLKVLLSGQGADELLLGYGTYYPYFLDWLRKTNTIKYISESTNIAKRYPSNVLKRLVKKNQHDYAQFSSIDHRKKKPASTLESYYLCMIQEKLLPALLQFEDRNSMAHGVEGRLPFLDAIFSEVCHKMTPESKIKRGIRKSIFRKSMESLVPAVILKRKDKMGYVAPQEKWMYDHRQHFINKITEGVKEFPSWLKPEIIPWIREVLNKNKKEHFPYVWRVYSFMVFLKIQ